MGVLVGGTGVLAGVDVGGTGVLIGGTGVGVGSALTQLVIRARTNIIPKITLQRLGMLLLLSQLRFQLPNGEASPVWK